MTKILAAYARQNVTLVVTTVLLACTCALVGMLPGARIAPVVGYWVAPLVWLLALSVFVGFPWGKFLFTLPLAHRTLGRAAWLGAVAGPVMIAMLGKLVAWVIVASSEPERASVGWIAISTLFDVACAGATVFVLSAQRRGIARFWSAAGWVVALVAVPMLAVIATPPSTTHVSAFGTVCLVAGLAMTVQGWRGAPRLAAASGIALRAPHGEQRRTTAADEMPPSLPPIPSSRLRQVGHYLLRQFLISCLLSLITLVLFGLLILADGGSVKFADAVREFLTEPLDAGFMQLAVIIALMPIPVYSAFSALSKPRWLRVLPFASWEVSALVLVRGLTFFAGLATLFLILGVVAGVRPALLDAGRVALLAGAACLTAALSFGVKSASGWNPVVTSLIWVIGFSSSRLMRFVPSDPQLRTATLASIGLVCLAVSIVVVHRRVTASRTIYKPGVTPFGLFR